MPNTGVSGKALAVIMVGTVLAYSGIKGKSISRTTRDLIYGQNPADDPTQDTALNADVPEVALNGTVGGPSGAAAKVGAAVNPGHIANMKVVQMLAQPYGWSTGSEWDALNKVIMRESGYSNTAQNPKSTAYGIFQFLDGTWAGTGIGKTSDPKGQTQAGLLYIKHRYGDPIAAWNHELQYGWY